MAGPDRRLDRNDGTLRVRIEAEQADPFELSITLKRVTEEWESPVSGESSTIEFPLLEITGFARNDRYRFGASGSSWSEKNIIEEEAVAVIGSLAREREREKTGESTAPETERDRFFAETGIKPDSLVLYDGEPMLVRTHYETEPDEFYLVDLSAQAQGILFTVDGAQEEYEAGNLVTAEAQPQEPSG